MDSLLSLEDQATLAVLGERQSFRAEYWRKCDPLLNERLEWRASVFRHLVHLLPGQRVVLLGVPERALVDEVRRITRGRNPVTLVTFDKSPSAEHDTLEGEEFLSRAKEGEWADCLLGFDLLDQRNCGHLLDSILRSLTPGGRMILFETNPWNPWLRTKRRLGLNSGDTRRLLQQSQLYELISEVGFIQVFAVFHDFVYGPVARCFGRTLKNASVLLENLPVVRNFSGTIIVHARKPGASPPLAGDLTWHECLRKAVSVVVPCHNEETNIRPLVGALRAHYNDYLHEIILVDDNSNDRTRKVIGELAADDARIKPVLRTPPCGVGRALKDGYQVATGKWVLSMDCDFQHLLPEFEDLFDAAAEGAEVVVGSRFSRKSVLLNYPWTKIVANRGFHLLMNLVFGLRFRDLTNNLKLMRRNVVETLQLQSPGFSANAETGLVPVLQGYSVAEIPISWVNRSPGMGVSSFKLARVGGGYVAVMRRLWGERKKFRISKVQSMSRVPSAASDT